MNIVPGELSDAQRTALASLMMKTASGLLGGSTRAEQLSRPAHDQRRRVLVEALAAVEFWQMPGVSTRPRGHNRGCWNGATVLAEVGLAVCDLKVLDHRAERRQGALKRTRTRPSGSATTASCAKGGRSR